MPQLRRTLSRVQARGIGWKGQQKGIGAHQNIRPALILFPLLFSPFRHGLVSRQQRETNCESCMWKKVPFPPPPPLRLTRENVRECGETRRRRGRERWREEWAIGRDTDGESIESRRERVMHRHAEIRELRCSGIAEEAKMGRGRKLWEEKVACNLQCAINREKWRKRSKKSEERGKD